jgi:hypothetical protein
MKFPIISKLFNRLFPPGRAPWSSHEALKSHRGPASSTYGMSAAAICMRLEAQENLRKLQASQATQPCGKEKSLKL